MGLSDELRAGVGSIWERVVTHPFFTEMADGSLDRVRFDRYFDQDYLFLKDWAILLSLATAKAPDFDAARELVGFLHLGLGVEEGLFQEAFRERGISREAVKALEYLPTTQNYSGYLRTQAYEGTFIEVAGDGMALPGLGPARRASGPETGGPLLPDLDRYPHQSRHVRVRDLAPQRGRWVGAHPGTAR